MTGASIAFAAGVAAVAHKAGVSPLPAGITTVEAGDWTLTVNNSAEENRPQPDRDPIGPWTLLAENNRYFVIAIMDPTGGAVGGGMTEAEFIDQMNALGPTPNPSA